MWSGCIGLSWDWQQWVALAFNNGGIGLHQLHAAQQLLNLIPLL